MTNEQLRQKIYSIVDAFLVEAKDQRGVERSLEQLNRDRHLAVEAISELMAEEKKLIYAQFEDDVEAEVTQQLAEVRADVRAEESRNGDRRIKAILEAKMKAKEWS